MTDLNPITGSFKIDTLRFEYGFATEPKSLSKPWVKQVHGTGVLEVTTSSQKAAAEIEGDAVITSVKSKEIYVYTADCLPVLLAGVDPDGRAHVAAIHSGWRGTMRGVVPATLSKWPLPLSRTIAVLGPAIRPCHFEVRDDFVKEFSQSAPRGVLYLEERDGKKFFDLPRFVAQEQLRGVSHIHVQHQACTYCDPRALPSYRRNKGTDPQIRAWIRFS